MDLVYGIGTRLNIHAVIQLELIVEDAQIK
jgi:hypothetical protein